MNKVSVRQFELVKMGHTTSGGKVALSHFHSRRGYYLMLIWSGMGVAFCFLLLSVCRPWMMKRKERWDCACSFYLPRPSSGQVNDWCIFFWCRTSSSTSACQLDGLPIHICLCLSTWACSRASFQSFLFRIIVWYHRGPSEYGSASALLFGRSSQLGGFGAAVTYSLGIFYLGK